MTKSRMSRFQQWWQRRRKLLWSRLRGLSRLRWTRMARGKSQATLAAPVRRWTCGFWLGWGSPLPWLWGYCFCALAPGFEDAAFFASESGEGGGSRPNCDCRGNPLDSPRSVFSGLAELNGPFRVDCGGQICVRMLPGLLSLWECKKQ